MDATIRPMRESDLSAARRILRLAFGTFAGVPDPEIPAPPESAATGEKKVRVVKLDEPARDRAKPFVIRSIKRT